MVVWEFSGSGHIDAVMITFVALALVARKAQRDVLTGLLLGAAVLTKFFPLVLFPAFYRRWSWKMPLALVLTCALGYTIYRGAGWRVLGFLAGYANEEGINSGRYFLLLLVRFVLGNTEIPVAVYLSCALLTLAAISYFTVFRWNRNDSRFLANAGLLAFAFTFLLSPQFPWYWTWIVPFLAFLPRRKLLPVFLITTGALFRYGTWFND